MIKGKTKLRLSLKTVIVIIIISTILYLGYNDIVKYIENSPTDAALKYYQQKYNVQNMEEIRANSIRLGCHEEIRVYKGNEILMKVNYINGRIYE